MNLDSYKWWKLQWLQVVTLTEGWELLQEVGAAMVQSATRGRELLGVQTVTFVEQSTSKLLQAASRFTEAEERAVSFE